MRLKYPLRWGLTLKIVAVIIGVSLPLWLLLNSYQNNTLRALFTTKEYRQLESAAQEDRQTFDQYSQGIYRSVKLIVGQKRFVDYIETLPQVDAANTPTIYHQDAPPRWMPRPSLMRSFYTARFALLYDDKFNLREVYHQSDRYSGIEVIPRELVGGSAILRKLSHNQAYMTKLGGKPYLLASERVRMGDSRVTLMLATPIDNQFLQEVASRQHHKTILALLDKETRLIVGSSDVSQVAVGKDLDDLQQDYFMAGKSFFDYGASDLTLQLSSFAPKGEVMKTIDSLVAASNYQRAVLMVVMLTTFMIIMLLFVRRVLSVSRTVNFYSNAILGRDISEHTEGDELTILGKQIDTLGMEVELLRHELNHEIGHARLIAMDLEARTDSLTHVNKQLELEIEERKRSEAERDELHQQLQRAQRMDAIGQITGGVAHDFNNILAAILGYTDLIRLKYGKLAGDESLRQYVSEISAAGKRGRDLVASMLAFSRGELGEPQLLQVEDEIDSVIRMMRPTIASTIEINKLIDHDKYQIKFDQIKFQQLLMNLIVNARDSFDGGKGIIDIRLRQMHAEQLVCASCLETFSGDYIGLSVRDNGKGIDHGLLGNIFEPFFSTKGVGEGSGMGLSVIHGIMHATHGHVMVESRFGGGTEFTLLFAPARGEEDSLQVDLLEEGQGSVRRMVDKRARIMVVDDESVMTSFFTELLKMNGYVVDAFNDPTAALTHFKAEGDAIDLVITDQMMPKVTGIELTERIREFDTTTPILMCTGYSATTDRDNALARGVTDFLAKPVMAEQLLATVDELLGGEASVALSGTASAQ